MAQKTAIPQKEKINIIPRLVLISGILSVVIAVAFAAASEANISIGVKIIMRVIYGSTLVLFVVPCVYDFFEDSLDIDVGYGHYLIFVISVVIAGVSHLIPPELYKTLSDNI